MVISEQIRAQHDWHQVGWIVEGFALARDSVINHFLQAGSQGNHIAEVSAIIGCDVVRNQLWDKNVEGDLEWATNCLSNQFQEAVNNEFLDDGTVLFLEVNRRIGVALTDSDVDNDSGL